MNDPIITSHKIFRALTDNHDESRRDEILNEIVDGDNDLSALLDDIKNPDYVDRELKKFNSFDVSEGWESVTRMVAEATDQSVQTGGRRRVKVLRLFKWTAVAAAVVVIFVVGLNLLNHKAVSLEPAMTVDTEIALAMAQSDEHGLTGAIIEKEVVREKPRRSAIVTDDKVPLSSPADIVTDLLESTKITTYYDKEYWLELSDGTIVHLGRNTRFVYPDRFIGSSRDVYLEGEAYFIVSPDKQRQFNVHTPGGTTRVYGTEFNVLSRSDLECDVVLVKGSVEVIALDGQSKMLKPGDMAEVTESGVTVKQVDTTPYHAWNTGRIDFAEWPLGKVLSVIARWYNKDVEFDYEEFRDVEISGSFNRYEDLEPTLTALSVITGLKLTDDCGTIKVSL